VVVHRHGKAIKGNPAVVKLAGFARPEEMIGMPVLALSPGSVCWRECTALLKLTTGTHEDRD